MTPRREVLASRGRRVAPFLIFDRKELVLEFGTFAEAMTESANRGFPVVRQQANQHKWMGKHRNARFEVEPCEDGIMIYGHDGGERMAVAVCKGDYPQNLIW